MTVVSSKEFATNQKKYYNKAVSENVFIKRGKNMFHLICTNIGETESTEEKKANLLNRFLDFAKDNYATDPSFKFNRRELYE